MFKSGFSALFGRLHDVPHGHTATLCWCCGYPATNWGLSRGAKLIQWEVTEVMGYCGWWGNRFFTAVDVVTLPLELCTASCTSWVTGYDTWETPGSEIFVGRPSVWGLRTVWYTCLCPNHHCTRWSGSFQKTLKWGWTAQFFRCLCKCCHHNQPSLWWLSGQTSQNMQYPHVCAFYTHSWVHCLVPSATG